MKFYLSIWWGYNSGAALFGSEGKNFRIIAGSQEERFNRSKNTCVFPCKTLDWLKDNFYFSESNLEAVLYTTNDDDAKTILVEKNKWTVSDYIKENNLYFKETLINNKKINYFDIFRQKIQFDQYPGENFWRQFLENINYNSELFEKEMINLKEEIIINYLGINKSKLKSVEHHSSHAWYAWGANPDKSNRKLVFTMDGWGDGRNATVSIFEKNIRKEIYSSSGTNKYNECNIGRVYRCMTLYLGMKPNEHEYKIMGLAPYGDEKYCEDAIKVFRDSVLLCDGDFKKNSSVKDSFFYYKERLEGVRFDNLAFALQNWVEDIVEEWVLYYIEKTGIKDVAFAGGVAMNVKAMGRILENPKVKSLFVPPSSGDESHIFGAGYSYLYENGFKENQNSFINAYFGYQNKTFNSKKDSYKIISNPSPKQVSNLLKSKKSVAVCIGATEFGARALGNRSILIDPRDYDLKEKLNLSIKNRDFWMPFAPIVLDIVADKYLLNNKKAQSPFMTISFQTTTLGRENMKAAIHPKDKTCRPQILTRNANSYLYDILLEFYKLTNCGAILNTSFNIHGEPIVNSYQDALRVFEMTELDALLLDSNLLIKHNNCLG